MNLPGISWSRYPRPSGSEDTRLGLFWQINSHYEFYDELDLDCNDRAFLSDTSDKSVVNKYRLHSVLVHSGGPHGGHYYAFIKSDGKWYRFEDELVKEETTERAISEQFGQDLSS